MNITRRLVDAVEPRLPALARAVGTPSVKGATASTDAAGTIWRHLDSAPRAVVVYLTDTPALARWLAGSVAVRLGAVVLVPASIGHPEAICEWIASVAEAVESTGELRSGAPTILVAEGSAASVALTIAARTASRLALLYPVGLPAVASHEPGEPAPTRVLERVPTTLIQAAASGAGRPSVITIDPALRRAGTAVRETEYAGVADGWARYPRLSAGSKRAADDLIAFLGRGIGETSTFEVIPGWDLH